MTKLKGYTSGCTVQESLPLSGICLLDDFELDESVMKEADCEAGHSVCVPNRVFTIAQHCQEVKVGEEKPGKDPSKGNTSRDLHNKGTNQSCSKGTKLLADLAQSHFSTVSHPSVETGTVGERRKEREEEEEQVSHTHSSENGALLTYTNRTY